MATQPAPAAAQNPDLSGTWVFNAEKSELPDMGGRGGRGFGGGDMVIKVEGEKILITSQRPGRQGMTEVTQTFIPDGKPHTVGEGRMAGEGVANWKDGKLVVVISRETQRGSFSTTSSYALAADGTLVVEQEFGGMGGGGTMTVKMVYDKKG
jgi:hypothetical protein